MKRIFLKSKVALALGVVALFVTATAFARVGKQDFVLHNQTGVEIHQLFVSPHSTDDWEEDILGKGTLPDGDSLKITFEDREKHVHWDLKVVDSKGNSIEWEDLNLIEISEVTLHYKDGKAWADIVK
jgi:predicted HTH transcriptional regulator